MALEPMWQSNYVDLSDEAAIRFGAWCTVCGARYVSADEALDPALPVLAPPGSAATRAIEETKYRTFVEFDAAFRELTIRCYRCERPVCPDCWDEDNRMCGACVKAQGLLRSPHRGVHAAPLTDGRLRCIEPGQYTEASRPGWLNALLASQPQVGTNGGQPGASDAMWHSASAISPLDPPRQAPEPAPPSPSQAPAVVAAAAAAAAAVAALPSASIAASAPLSPPPPAPPLPAYSAIRVQAPPAPATPIPPPTPTPIPTPTRDYVPQEGKATSNMVQCPRCGAANYDFVTRCTVCQLQLIRPCPVCERLNPGHATVCESCGSPLVRPSGWSGVHARVMPLPPEEALPHTADKPTSSRGRRHGPRQRPMRASVAGAAASAPGSAQPQAPNTSLVGPGASRGVTSSPSAEVHQPELVHAPTGRGLTTILVVTERIVTVVLWLAIVMLIGGIVAAEVSTRADAVIKSIIHVDVRVSINTFWSWVQTWWQHDHK